MITQESWERQPGGLYLAVAPCERDCINHQHMALKVIRTVTENIAKSHGARVSENNLLGNMRALQKGAIHLDLFLAKWEICETQPLCLGASIHWPTIGLGQDGKLKKALYTEDLCVLPAQLRQLIRQKPTDKDFPSESLAACFERIALRHKALKEELNFRYGEIHDDNNRVKRALEKQDIHWGRKPWESAVLELGRIQPDLINYFPMNLRLLGSSEEGPNDSNSFWTEWFEEGSKINFAVTRGQSTTKGCSRLDIRSWRSGSDLDPEITKCVAASALLAIKREAEERGWTQEAVFHQRPRILHETTSSQIQMAVYDMVSSDLTRPFSGCERTLNPPVSEFHIHIFEDKPMMDAFMALGAVPRFFGQRPMMPGVGQIKNDIRHEA